MDRQENRSVVLVAFYNEKALGVRYLESALTQAGYQVTTIFFKRFNSRNPSPATRRELELLCQTVRQAEPLFVGLSVMSSMYLDSVNQVMGALAEEKLGPIVCGGAFASLEPAYFLRRQARYVIRLDGERPIVALAEALRLKTPPENIPSLCYLAAGQVHCNPVEMDRETLGELLPAVQCQNACLIDGDQLIPGDPQRSILSYEVVASRGCPFTCSYCSCVNLRRLYPEGTRAIRPRPVECVIRELEEAVHLCHSIAFVHFYDEIFPNLPGWIDTFVEQYRQRIGLPFSIWSHPKVLEQSTLNKLVKAGLVEVIMGIQSGSPYIRREIFHRYETNKEIVEASRLIKRSGVFWASYDFMLRHPFETADTLRESYELAKELEGRFELQLHGLNFLPGTDIVDIAVEQGKLTQVEMERILYAPMTEQFRAYWQQDGSVEAQLWYMLLYLWQFPCFRNKCLRYEKAPARFEPQIRRNYARGQKLARLRYVYKKAGIVLRRLVSRKRT